MKTARFFIKEKGKRRLSMLTCYDAMMAQILQEVLELDMLLIGDSLGNVVCGERSTVPVTLEQVIYHAKQVRRGAPDLFLVGDMPFMTYPFPEAQALDHVKRLIQESGVEAVKFEGAASPILTLIEKCVLMGCAVMGHIGVTPQQVYREGYRRKGKQEEEAKQLVAQAKDLERAGVFAMVLECVQADVAAQITQAVSVPTIGIGSGNGCDGQVWVTPDLLGLLRETPPFMKPLTDLRTQIQNSVKNYMDRVQRGTLYPES